METDPNLAAPDSTFAAKPITVANEAKDCGNEPFKIILYPPQNKEFYYDNDTHAFNIQSVESSRQESADIGTIKYATNIRDNSGLTPLVETLKIFQDNAISVNPSSESEESNTKNQNSIRQILKIEKVFKHSKLGDKCFLKGCKWSPDGLCLLTNSDDNILRLFEVSEHLINNPEDDVSPVLQMKEGGTIYDYEWYPQMSSSDPISCVFAAASQDSPIHLWDAYTGGLRATYQPINQFDEVTPAYSIAFSPDGTKLYSGYKKVLRVFNICHPGRLSEERPLKIKGNSVSQANIASTISVNTAMPYLYAVGCYDKTIGLYGEPEGDLLFVLHGHSGGVTQVKFSKDGYYLFSGGRKDSEILCWDIRNPGKLVYSIARKVETQQKIQFDLSSDDTYLITGSTDCNLKLYNLKKSPNDENILEPVEILRGHEDCVNGVHFHPKSPLVASASGQRHFSLTNISFYGDCSDDEKSQEDCSDDDDSMEKGMTVENSLKIWSLHS